jgi:hypothetical protein
MPLAACNTLTFLEYISPEPEDNQSGRVDVWSCYLKRLVACFRPLSASLSPMLQLGNLSAWITVDGKELKEYGVEISDDGKEATCWIPSKVGQVRSTLFEYFWRLG